MILCRLYIKTNVYIHKTKEIIKLFLTLYYSLQLGINNSEFADDPIKKLSRGYSISYQYRCK